MKKKKNNHFLIVFGDIFDYFKASPHHVGPDKGKAFN